ncbi:helicase HerA domain-containing protein [Methylobacterium goesingense]|uniref:GTPase SAR1 family protein n=1 Tax=Methylobacterium goesingense TaxID=243690 RepID=A0ABV2L1K0_9HYPH|nr:DUF87 domain-containing protein [Methylobacterium goesingense]GJD72601.1 hypothetical protein CFIICLFH_0818 [Methylobacterium goesingense]
MLATVEPRTLQEMHARKVAADRRGEEAALRLVTSSLKPAAPPLPATPTGDIVLGRADTGGNIGIDLQALIEGRLLVQGASGSGKSWTLRRLLEQTAGRVQQVVIDPEGEFSSLAESYGHLRVDAHHLDAAAMATLAHRVREHRLSILVDFSDLDREGQMIAIAALFGALIDSPPEHWNSTIVAVDEAHLFAPFGGHSSAPASVRNASIAAVTDLMSRGRKRGLAGILATQRLNRLSKSVISEAHNYLIGLNTLDLDIRRAAETIGWDARRAFDRLPMLKPGEFVAVGSAFSRSPAVTHVGPVQTQHRGAAPTLAAPAPLDANAAARLLDLEHLAGVSAADAETRAAAAMAPGLKAVRGFIRDPAFATAGKAWGALLPLAPEGATVAELAAFLEVPAQDLAAGLALLDAQGVLEFTGEGATRAVRVEEHIAKELRP